MMAEDTYSISSNILVNRLLDEGKYSSNYTERLDNRSSNYAFITSSIFLNRMIAEDKYQVITPVHPSAIQRTPRCPNNPIPEKKRKHTGLEFLL